MSTEQELIPKFATGEIPDGDDYKEFIEYSGANGPVMTVNGKKGAVVLTSDDVDAMNKEDGMKLIKDLQDNDTLTAETIAQMQALESAMMSSIEQMNKLDQQMSESIIQAVSMLDSVKTYNQQYTDVEVGKVRTALSQHEIKRASTTALGHVMVDGTTIKINAAGMISLV